MTSGRSNCWRTRSRGFARRIDPHTDPRLSAEPAAAVEAWGSATSIGATLRLSQHIQPNPQNLAVVAHIRTSGRTAALASNRQSQQATCMKEGLGYGALFDQMLFSCELGFTKPDAQYFNAALQLWSPKPGEAVFIDHHFSIGRRAEDDAAAQNLSPANGSILCPSWRLPEAPRR
jgi:FMN phosphatase YigB (HAD superfamily)